MLAYGILKLTYALLLYANKSEGIKLFVREIPLWYPRMPVPLVCTCLNH